MGLRDMFKKKSDEDKIEKTREQGNLESTGEKDTKKDGIKIGLKKQLTEDKSSATSNDQWDIESEMTDRLREKAGDAYKT
jgi:hypothetical protein